MLNRRLRRIISCKIDWLELARELRELYVYQNFCYRVGEIHEGFVGGPTHIATEPKVSVYG